MADVKSLAVDYDPFADGEIAGAAPMTGPQRELWSAVQLGGDEANCAYNEGISLRFTGALDAALLGRCLDELVARHESLRTTFAADGSASFIAPSGSLPLTHLDLRGESDVEAAYRKLEEQAAAQPFDLARGPLARAQLVRTSEREHRLLLTVHHIVCDGWSFGVLVSELSALYSAAKQGRAPELDPPESYAAYARERAEHEQSSEARKSLTYWLEQYRDGVPVLDLPIDRPRPALRTYRSERIDYALKPELVTNLRTIAKQHSASLLQLLLSSFQTLVARLSGQWDLVVGVPSAGQASTGRLGLVGHAVGFLPIRSQLDASATFLDTLARTRRTLADALDHQDVSFGTLLENLAIARDPSRVPIAPLSFNYEAAFAGASFVDLEVTSRNVARSFEIFELFVNVVDRRHTLEIEAQYNSDLFDRETIADWLASYEALLAGIAASPDEQLSRLPVLDGAARTRILEHWNATQTPFERDTPIHGFFEQRAAQTPERDALVFEDERLSYAELDARANRLARHLQKLGVGPEHIVGICMRRSLDMVVAQLGILKAGAAYLPLDPSYPSERLAYMLEDAGARVIVSREDSIAAVGAAQTARVLLDAQREQLAAESSAPLASGVRADNVAYVIYTSGSTGKPKGVLVEHRNFANFLAGMDQRLALSPPGVWLCATSIGFDISLLELFGALGRGFTVVLHSDESGPEHDLPSLLARHAITHFQCTPAQATVLLGDPRGPAALAGLHELLLGGEALPVDLARKLEAQLVKGRLVNMYGPTETTIWSTTHPVHAPESTVPIGTPIANTRVYVLDAHGEPCARGAIGELCIGGAGVTRGYHRRPDLTRERFVRDPFVRDPAARMYRTGDLARFRKDGAIEFLGRNDFQVKVRGYRIELGEIEIALRAHPAVREAVVVAREDRAGDKKLVAYLVCTGAPTVQELKSALLSSGLPDYMLPQAFVTLSKLPTTPNGKLDRRALPSPDLESGLSTGSYLAPRTETEQKLAQIWQSVLGMGRVSITSSFFDLGGHSLLAVRLVNQIASELSITLPITRLFQAPTIEQLAAYVDAVLLTSPAPTTSDETREEIEL